MTLALTLTAILRRLLDLVLIALILTVLGLKARRRGDDESALETLADWG